VRRIEKFLCLLSRADPGLYTESNTFDRRTICANAIALLTSGVVAAIAWTVFWASFISIWFALSLGLLIGLIIIQLDSAIGASDWELVGVLRTGKSKASSWFKLILRMVIACFLALVTADGVTLVMCSRAINNHMQNKRTIQNAVVEKDYAARKKEIRSEVIGSLEKKLAIAQEERSRTVEKLTGLRLKRREAQKEAGTAYIEAGREEHGLNRPRGKGPRYDDAMRHREVEKRLEASLTEEIKNTQTSIKALDSRMEKLNEQMRSSKKDVTTQWQALDKEKTRDSRWVPERDDPLLRYIALQEIKHHPVYGQAVREFDWLSKIFLITFELMFLLIKVVFAPASVYMVRLLARHKQEASEVANKYSDNIYKIRRSHPSAQLHIVGGKSQ
jgi:hypothetical protein